METELIPDSDITPVKVAEFFLTKDAMTPKKLQKLVYYAYAWFIALYNDDPDDILNTLFTEQPEAWVHGPVFPSLFREYKQYQWHEVPRIDKKIKFENDEVHGLLELIWKNFGKYTADQLEAITHQEKPWREARGDVSVIAPSSQQLSKRTIFEYYNELTEQAA